RATSQTILSPNSVAWQLTWVLRICQHATVGMPMGISRTIRLSHDRLPVFLDTAYVNALVNVRGQWHNMAVQWEERLAVERRRLLTTEVVLGEIADGVAGG